MKVESSKTGKHPEKSTDRIRFAKDWESINWHTVVKTVNSLQKRIVKATRTKNRNQVKRLTYLLTHSLSAKLLAVRRVTSNKGRHTPGVDGETWLTSEQKMKGALELTDKHYRAKPLKRVFIDKKGKKEKRPLGIPTMHDRAMQALYALALSPIAETTADMRSFGFRMGRSAQDAMTYVHEILSRRYSPEWILEGDIKGCFDNISHDWLMENIPMDKRILRQFLKAGYIFEEELFPSECGTPQGGIISPILANMTLDGIQNLLDGLTKRKVNHKTHLVRYADDFIITTPTKEQAELIKEELEVFFKPRGLELSKEKTLITHIKDGFDFLGWNCRKFKGKLIIRPSNKSIENFKKSMHETILEKGKAMTQEDLISALNPKIRGWSQYHRNTCAKQTFEKLDHDIFKKLMRWAQRRHPKKGKHWTVDKYWHCAKSRKWVFATESKQLEKLSDVKIIRMTQLKLDMNPFTDWKYFLIRKEMNKSRFTA